MTSFVFLERNFTKENYHGSHYVDKSIYSSYNPAMKRIVLSEEELNEQKVILKPIFGIQPESYISYVYAFLIALALFLILFLPGILKNGTYYHFSSAPQGASVYVDNLRLGATPGTYFVPKGERVFTLKSPYHETLSSKVNVKGNIFASLFFKRKKNYNGELVFNMDSKKLKDVHLDAASWFQSDEGYSSQPLPPIMTSLARGFYRSKENHSDITDKDIREFNLTLLRSISQNQSFREWQESAALYLTKGKVLNPGSYLKALAEGADFLAANPEVLTLLSSYLEQPEVKGRPESITTPKIFKKTSSTASYQPEPEDPLRFRPVGTLISGNQEFDVFAADREITKGWYSLFLEDNPSWALASLPELKEKQLADDRYLSDWDITAVPVRSQEPMRFVSHYAAEEFCEWMQKKYFNSPVMTVRLPNEWEWEELARENGLKNSDRPSQKNLGPLEAGSFQAGNLKLYDMEGNLWEWCSNNFGTNDSLLKGSEEIMDSVMPFPDYAVRGGSWANSSGQVNSETRASQPADWCTAYVGFRPLLIVKRK